ncbi:AEC family transporter [Omnitrophica bacterium]|nr:AEC family transporter [Candidatus Omnitrophota bacterium]
MVIQVLAKVGALFLMMAVGALARFKKVITDEALDALCKIVLYVTLPFLFIYVLSTKCVGDTILSFWTAPLFAVAIIFIGYGVAWAAAKFLRLSPKRKGTFIFLISFQNSGFLAIPIALALFGDEGVLNIIIFNIGFNVLYWTFGVWLFSQSNTSVKHNPFVNLVNTGTIALALGIVLGAFCVKLPGFLLDASKTLGAATIPLAMLVVGAILAGSELKKGIRFNFKEISAVVVCRLVLIPIIFLGLVRYLGGASQLMRSIIILQACMPSASTSPLLAKRLGGDYDLAASGVFFTTLISIITIPLFMSLV